ncbi:uncharacterized protein LOC129286294 [Prosopis cineraria]|uniref:uncharacterized protein LOC129286294 n=1 Tax=Prosopis cineraria TaxID=364024 RepID=UPI0024101435|nr:uncharacterized protein LOC129286294 [Prosopis cineraria]
MENRVQKPLCLCLGSPSHVRVFMQSRANSETIAAEAQNKAPDANSPFFLHASDNPGQVFVSELLNENNYMEWQTDITNALVAKNKMGFIDGLIKQPELESNVLSYWIRCDAMVKGWLKSSMSKELRASVRYVKTAHEIWTNLAEHFGKGSAPRAYELRRNIANLRQQRQSITVYYTKLKALWDEIRTIAPTPRCTCNGCTCGVARDVEVIRDNEQVYDFLMGLDEEFATVKTHILSRKPLMNLSAAYHLVVEDEKQRQVSATQRNETETMAFQRGHTEERCFEIHGYPPNWKRSNREKKWNEKRGGPRAAFVNSDESPISGLSLAQYDGLLKAISEGLSDSQIS